MSTTPITVHVNVTSVTKREIEAAEKREQRARARIQGEADAYASETGTGVAKAGEVAGPQKKSLGQFDKQKLSLDQLKKAFLAAGGNGKVAVQDPAKLLTAAEDLLEQFEGMIAEETDPKVRARLEVRRDELELAVKNHVALQSEAVTASTTVETASTSASGQGDQGTNPQEQILWQKLTADLESLGIDVTEVSEGRDVEKVRVTVTDKIGKELMKVQARIKTLTDQATNLQNKLKTASTPEEKQNLEKQLKDAQNELGQLTLRKQELTQGFARFSAAADQILAYQVASDLGQELTPKSAKTFATKSAPKTSVPSTGQKSTTSPTLGTQSAPATGGAGGGGPLLGTQSATGGGAEYVSPGGVSGSGGSSQATLSTASASDEAPAADLPAGGGVPLVAANDFSGTTLAIQATGQSLKREAKKTDQIIKKLLKAALAGNWQAVKACLIFLDKRASMITINMGAQTIKAMQNYEKQMSVLSNSLGKLKGTEPDYNAKLAKINSEMNMYSMNRQAIANFLRDTLTMREETANLTKSVLDVDRQIAQSISR